MLSCGIKIDASLRKCWDERETAGEISLLSLGTAFCSRVCHTQTANYSLDWISFWAQKEPPVFNFCVLEGVNKASRKSGKPHRTDVDVLAYVCTFTCENCLLNLGCDKKKRGNTCSFSV